MYNTINSFNAANLSYFKTRKAVDVKFWSALGGIPCFEGLTILDVGCGHGSLCVDMASRGAKKVIGIDTNEELIKFATQNVKANYPNLHSIIEFRYCDVNDLLNKELFEFIVCKATFEHILEPKRVLEGMKRRLKVKGKIFIGFGPLWNSPTGGHGRIHSCIPIPFGHLIFPESYIVKRVNKRRSEKISSIYELGLNKLSFADYKELFYNSGLFVSQFCVNQGESLMTKVFSLFRRIPFLSEYCTTNLYCVLEKVR